MRMLACTAGIDLRREKVRWRFYRIMWEFRLVVFTFAKQSGGDAISLFPNSTFFSIRMPKCLVVGVAQRSFSVFYGFWCVKWALR